MTLNAWSIAKPDLRELAVIKEIDVDDESPARPFTVLDQRHVTIRAVRVPHLAKSYAYRIDSDGGWAVFSGDTSPSEDLADFAAGADVLVHEVMDLEALARQGFPMEFADLFKQVRTEVADVGRIAARSGVPTLVLSHFVPATRTIALERWIERIEKDYDGRIIVPEDLMRMPVAKPSLAEGHKDHADD